MNHQEFALNSLLEALKSTRVSPGGVSFAGKSLKLNTADDAKEVVIAINQCQQLEFLNLEGNTLGVDAAKAVAEALEKHPEFKRALWKDMFTGRMKTEIPQALKFLGAGLVKAQAHLTELDLSDNAFGPIGVEGLAALLRSPSCYALEELRLNNNGLGITGGKLLASALTDCYNHSSKEGKPLPLRVFIAGRNRLENEGAGALAEVFKKIKTLEEVAMPQNGIYHVGITALSEAFKENRGLKVLNLNDNTFGEKGAEAIGKVLVNLQELKEINFGDCLLKTKGALLIAKGLNDGHLNLEELILESNEIRKQGGLALVTAMANKSKLKNLLLDANQFGDDGVKDIKNKLKEMGKLNVLGSLEDNESEGESDDEPDQSDSESEKSSDSAGEVEIEEIIEEVEDLDAKITIKEFLDAPSAQNLLLLGGDRANLILQAAKNEEFDVNNFVSVLMKVCSLTDNSQEAAADQATKITEILYKELFSWAQTSENLSTVNNCLLVNLGLIKSEDRNFKPTWNLIACRNFLQKISQANFVPESTKDTVKVFLSRQMEK